MFPSAPVDFCTDTRPTDGATADRINFHMLANEGEQLSNLRITFLTDAYHGGSPVGKLAF